VCPLNVRTSACRSFSQSNDPTKCDARHSRSRAGTLRAHKARLPAHSAGIAVLRCAADATMSLKCRGTSNLVQNHLYPVTTQQDLPRFVIPAGCFQNTAQILVSEQRRASTVKNSHPVTGRGNHHCWCVFEGLRFLKTAALVAGGLRRGCKRSVARPGTF
jgi:hypothetical protein